MSSIKKQQANPDISPNIFVTVSGAMMMDYFLIHHKSPELASKNPWTNFNSQPRFSNEWSRIRPPSLTEAELDLSAAVKCVDEKVVVFDPADPNKPQQRGPQGVRRGKDINFSFDRVFDAYATQYEIFEHTTKPLVDELLNGYNCCCFAYGATGSGKTYTMVGNAEQPGVMVLTLQEIFSAMSANRHEKIYDLSISYLEIYNETICDLLISQSKQLFLRESKDGCVNVSGLSQYKPESADQVLKLLEEGNARRTQSFTFANSESSRSHAVLQIIIQQRDRTANVTTGLRTGKLSLIDLAGSERASKTKNKGQLLVEGANINRSLLALGNCINALGEGYKEGKYVPYRDSKLTRLLKDSLGGNCKTVMISNLSPSMICYEDTFNTLQYANRAKNIKTKIRVNELDITLHVSQYKDIIADLRKNVDEYKIRLAEVQNENIQLKQRLQRQQLNSHDQNDASFCSTVDIFSPVSPTSTFSNTDRRLFEIENSVDSMIQDRCNISKNLDLLAQRHQEGEANRRSKLHDIYDWQVKSQVVGNQNRSSPHPNLTPMRIRTIRSQLNLIERRKNDDRSTLTTLLSRLSKNASRSRKHFDQLSSHSELDPQGRLLSRVSIHLIALQDMEHHLFKLQWEAQVAHFNMTTELASKLIEEELSLIKSMGGRITSELAIQHVQFLKAKQYPYLEILPLHNWTLYGNNNLFNKVNKQSNPVGFNQMDSSQISSSIFKSLGPFDHQDYPTSSTVTSPTKQYHAIDRDNQLPFSPTLASFPSISQLTTMLYPSDSSTIIPPCPYLPSDSAAPQQSYSHPVFCHNTAKTSTYLHSFPSTSSITKALRVPPITRKSIVDANTHSQLVDHGMTIFSDRIVNDAVAFKTSLPLQKSQKSQSVSKVANTSLHPVMATKIPLASGLRIRKQPASSMVSNSANKASSLVKMLANPLSHHYTPSNHSSTITTAGLKHSHPTATSSISRKVNSKSSPTVPLFNNNKPFQGTTGNRRLITPKKVSHLYLKPIPCKGNTISHPTSSSASHSGPSKRLSNASVKNVHLTNEKTSYPSHLIHPSTNHPTKLKAIDPLPTSVHSKYPYPAVSIGKFNIENGPNQTRRALKTVTDQDHLMPTSNSTSTLVPTLSHLVPIDPPPISLCSNSNETKMNNPIDYLLSSEHQYIASDLPNTQLEDDHQEAKIEDNHLHLVTTQPKLENGFLLTNHDNLLNSTSSNDDQEDTLIYATTTTTSSNPIASILNPYSTSLVANHSNIDSLSPHHSPSFNVADQLSLEPHHDHLATMDILPIKGFMAPDDAFSTLANPSTEPTITSPNSSIVTSVAHNSPSSQSHLSPILQIMKVGK